MGCWNYSKVDILKKPRDQQRQRVYTAEKSISWGTRIERLDELQVWVDMVCASDWMKFTFGKVVITVNDGRRRKSPCARRLRCYTNANYEGIIKMPKFSRAKLIILHEIAHVLCPATYAAHGSEYVRIYLALVGQFMGTEKRRELIAAFKITKVKWNWWDAERIVEDESYAM